VRTSRDQGHRICRGIPYRQPDHQTGAGTLKRNHLELGGKNPVIVFDDADLDRALDAVIFMIYSITAERCKSSSRLLIQETIREDFESRLI